MIIHFFLFLFLFWIVIALNINTSAVSVSGISSGGYFAVQYHVAHSSEIMGAGIIAGGPYWCSQANVDIALTSCMTDPILISVDVLIAETYYAEGLLSIDPVSHLRDDKVFLVSGLNDTVVVQGVMKKLQTYYEKIGVRSIQTNFNIEAEHCFPTENYGNIPCTFLGSPYINKCGYDMAGQILQNIYGKLKSKVSYNPNNIRTINQHDFVPLHVDPELIGINSKGYVYVPTNCANSKSSCKLHVVFHGCLQSTENIGEVFILNAGYLEWAEANNIVVVFPQTQSNVLNPKACWDWWGYSGVDFATKIGPQIITINNIINYIESSKFE
ncbi:dipeptidyl peptidase four (iv) family [Anaeramoeba ignava]|uniref:Dipeptidyl peptidase four (Iv) family n=1 Tax=Anaeramoeba ignava TaxID=1746090 RepID=A0A9Q0L8W4_ANAIG|nr:dipeptidyl peptidase four (iv) family [Anaeramoeba ignava]